MNIVSKLPLLLTVFVFVAASADWLHDLAESAQEILKPVQIAAAETQLAEKEKRLLGMQDTRFLSAVVSCSNDIAASLDSWKDKFNIVISKQDVRDSRVYVEIDTVEPVAGALIVIYRFLSSNDQAYIKFLFDSNNRIDATQQEILVARYHLVELKRSLVTTMKCGSEK